jgi:hypothetical protein
VRSLDFTVQLRGSGFDVHVSDTLVLDVPVELGLPLVPAIRAYRMDAERKFVDDVIDEVDRTLLVVPLVDLQGPNPCGVIDCGVLIAFDLAAVFLSKGQELHVYLYLMAWDLFGVAAGVDGSPTDISWQAADSVAFESAVDA